MAALNESLATCERNETNEATGSRPFFDEIYDLVQKFGGYVVSKCTFEETRCLLIYHEKLFNHPPFGMTSRCRISITECEYVVHVLMKEIERGSIDRSSTVELLSKYATNSMIYKFCPGLDPSEYDSHKEIIRFNLKSARITTEPFLRVDSVNCLLWFKLGTNSSKERRQASSLLCPPCTRLKCDVSHQVKRTQLESPSKKMKRQSSTSRARLTYMSPSSQVKRKENQRIEKQSMKRKLEHIDSEADIPLDEQQHDELSSIMSIIEHEHPDELEKLFTDGDKCGVGHKLRTVWETDKRRDYNDFKKNQLINKTGKKGNRWSAITIRMALAVYVRSPAAYEALKSFSILQLPSRSTLQAYTGAFLHEAGANSVSIRDQVAQFLIHSQQREKEGKKASQKDGVLIFDEVKVINRLMWNSRSQKLIGLSMSYTEQSSLADIYQLMDGDQAHQTSYILQFLWRDLTSDFDIIGPYFTCSKTMDSKFIISCIFETIKLLHLHGLTTTLLVCDGASANLSTIKATHGYSGAYSIANKTRDPYEIRPCMVNPFNPPNPIFWLICPTHQLKNMVNALFSSKEGGTKSFVLDGVSFGWDPIVSMYERECARVSDGLTRMVPKLKEVHVIRDAWTKLNVTPAKIMQQEHVLSELYRYINENPHQPDVDITRKSLAYLEACSKLFEKGFLSHDRIMDMDSKVLQSIDEGYTFFTTWLDQILENDRTFEHASSEQRKYLAWQTFDLLRIDVYGFRMFCKHFLKKYPGYFISPLRVSGSAVETLFSQFKYNAGGKLDSANYPTARAACLIKQTATSHHSGKEYRNNEISTIALPLQKKIYQKKK